ncbi:UDP-N-acetylmuramoyl-L-alanine--D-glutamate ligase [Anabaena sp. FACHB-1237]|uniref:UDP-N-acetylmuramoyl-L-alanine--D-glutamate ligase n=1 Tax=Anabaena sp. FACHB-1237 TaxID=2692769 RepID=UPI00168155E0|nr:UDP-N-acetylmuramoyl-L-alanine--D-glutamate ligase [Anabaena sp. FACHB-1237]MBD2137476.1 UDP-N-acetylmuramoyl-L-alanine--D-glutamate ligase [Anabaena sp. FACHB-1237]
MPQALLIGLGKSGVAGARLLQREGWEVELCDSSTSSTLLKHQQQLATEQITVKLGCIPALDPPLPDLIVVSPGVPWDIPLLIKARQLGVETIGEIELAWRKLKNIPWVAITGTNGKTTTTTLTAAIFQTAGLNAPACGNIGYAACEVALYQHNLPTKLDWIVGEISSYQIESSSTLSPQIGIFTTFTPDHLARHKTLENYYNIKAKLLKSSQQQILNGDDAYLHNLGLEYWPDAYWTSVKGAKFLIGEKGFYIEDGWVIEKLSADATPQQIVPTSALKMVGEHNLQNLLMSVGAARLANINIEAINEAVIKFPGVSHRLEYICTWENIDFINDSKATNYDAAEVALASVKSPVILIAGGEAKAGDEKAWIEKIKSKAVAVLLIGSAATFFAEKLKNSGYDHFEIVETMENAVIRSAELGKKYQASVVLLSPACASFDQYPNFEKRGDHFRQLCEEILRS